jgi:GT2 family glycosyltransferase
LSEPRFTASFIVHQNYGYISEALRSLYASTRTPFDVVVVINLGHSDAAAQLQQQFPHVKYLFNASPLGFAANHNQVMQQATTEYTALLNDDISIHDGALDAMIDWLDQHPKTAVTGAALFNPDGSPQVSVYSDPTLLRTLYRISPLASLTSQNSPARRILLRVGLSKLMKVESLQFDSTTRAVPIVKGAVMMVRRQAYEAVGLMDETTRAYGEEADWHYRFRRAGWEIVRIAEAKITHFGQGQAALQLQGWLLAEDRKAILNYYLKHRPRWQALTVRCALVVNHALFALLWLPIRRRRAVAHWSTFLMALRFHRTGNE